MKNWVMRNFVCRFKGHDRQYIPLFRPWWHGAEKEFGSINCIRCGAMIEEHYEPTIRIDSSW